MIAPWSRDPFGATGEFPHGLFYDGCTTRLQTGVVTLRRVLEADAAGLRTRCARLRAVFESREAGVANGLLFPDSNPGQAWPADVAVGATALEGCVQTVDPSSRVER
ncbi:hypothetical protein [Rubrivirga sp.]|uniref:hypothetical protein n=1 Tax=Rubrivirga sp. TaxID=1885344 RepID=UPI003C763BDD